MRFEGNISEPVSIHRVFVTCSRSGDSLPRAAWPNLECLAAPFCWGHRGAVLNRHPNHALVGRNFPRRRPHPKAPGNPSLHLLNGKQARHGLSSPLPPADSVSATRIPAPRGHPHCSDLLPSRAAPQFPLPLAFLAEAALIHTQILRAHIFLHLDQWIFESIARHLRYCATARQRFLRGSTPRNNPEIHESLYQSAASFPLDHAFPAAAIHAQIHRALLAGSAVLVMILSLPFSAKTLKSLRLALALLKSIQPQPPNLQAGSPA